MPKTETEVVEEAFFELRTRCHRLGVPFRNDEKDDTLIIQSPASYPHCFTYTKLGAQCASNFLDGVEWSRANDD